MWSVIGKALGSEKALAKTVEAASSAIDKLVYTEEEKADAAAAKSAAIQGCVVDWLKATQGQNLARRLIALSVTFSWLGFKILGVAVATAAVWNSAAFTDAEKLAKLVELYAGFTADMTGAVMLILGFYFGAPVLGDVAKTALDKFAGGKK